ncbi:YceI family protein [Pseudodesulfovibrio sp. zrk46]|uniref:YceI family protein n=1 Tax=Pseudodesulfovibrio sp. zrk46 TaxID=2725288 RepID=UPI00144A033C|nr:YceI family protein [Pseudodesulfovibrio sp. zrk46]QJB56800.1 YceI family protein [Pseudodesulfovibrio sp. zrk46]
MKKILLIAVALLFCATSARAETWNIDPDHSAAHFAIEHMMIAKVRGSFPDIKGALMFKDDMPVSFDVTIAVDSINTGVDKRDAHLKSGDFFGVTTYPVMTFKSTEVTRSGDGFVAKGNMTIKDKTHEVEFAVSGLTERRKDPWGNYRLGGKAKLVIDRRDFGVTWSQTLDDGGLLIGNEVDIVVDLELLPVK